MRLEKLLSSATLLALVCSCFTAIGTAAEKDEHLLRYKLQAGEQVVSRVTHFADTHTVMSGVAEESSSRTTSEKVWEVEKVDDDGNMTFVYKIKFVSLAQSVGDGEELKYNSKIDIDVPDIFAQVAKTVDKPLATITINPRGQVTGRVEDKKLPQLGFGGLTIPLPEEAVAVGGSWSVPREMRTKLDDGTYKRIKVRELYTLEKVSAGLATIKLVSQPLTPISDPAVEAKVMQQLNQGTIKFDIDRGRLVRKELNWQEEVIGFRGADTSIRYDAKFTEELVVPTTKTARRK